MRLSYLACPYTNPPEARKGRQAYADLYAALLAYQTAVFSPITHGTRLERFLPDQMVKNHRFWMDQCIPILRVCTDLYVLPLEGWRESKGVQEEIALAKQLLMPIYIIQSNDSSLEVIRNMEDLKNGWECVWLEEAA